MRKNDHVLIFLFFSPIHIYDLQVLLYANDLMGIGAVAAMA
jgi:hypothetical protein